MSSSRHKCTKALYQAFLQATCVRYSGLALSEVSPVSISHDSVSRFLQARHMRPREVWEQAKQQINLDEAGILIVDDSILDKQRSEKIDLVHYQYSGNEHRVIAGIGLVNLLWHRLEDNDSIPVDYRIYDKDTDGKTKNEHFREMLKSSKERGLKPAWVVMDAWYSSLDNLKAIRDLDWIWVAGLKKNRKVNRDELLENLVIPDEGLKIHLRGYGFITVFRFVGKNGRTDYIGTNMEDPNRPLVEAIVRARWSIEVYHRELKQTCGIERCQARTGRAQRNHICLAILTWLKQRLRRCQEGLTFYEQQWQTIKTAISKQMENILMTT